MCPLFLFPTKYCKLHKFIPLIRVLSSFSAVIHTSYRHYFVNAHILCGMHDALLTYRVHRRKQEAFKGGNVMNCARCNGLMVVDDCLDVKGGMGELWIRAHRCIMCGNITDSVIDRHRTTPVQAQVLPFRKRLRRAPRTPVARLTA